MQESNIIQKHLQQIQYVMQKHGVIKAYAFGSAVRGNMNCNSDVDFLICFPVGLDAKMYSDSYFSLLDELEYLLDRKVELTAEETLSNPYLIQSINNHKMQVL